MITKDKKVVVGWQSPVAIHPGEFLEEALKEYNLSQIELSERIGITPKVINEIIKGKNPITRTTASKLSKIFPMSAGYWTNLQQSYEDDVARIEETEKLEKEVKTYLPAFQETYKELSGRGAAYGISGLRWAQQHYNDIALELQKFYAVDTLAYFQGVTASVVFRKYKRENLNPYTLAAWLRIGEIKAQKTEVAPFSKDKLKEQLPALKKLSQEKHAKYLPEITNLLADCGVVVAYMPHMKKTHTQGASKWITPTKVLLMLNTHKRDEGKFWFNLFHELGHIVLHSKKECFVDLDGGDVSEIEKQADEFAQKWLIPDFDATWEEFKKRNKTQKDLAPAIRFVAEKNGVSDAIIAGRFTNEFKDKYPKIYAEMSGFLKERIDVVNV